MSDNRVEVHPRARPTTAVGDRFVIQADRASLRDYDQAANDVPVFVPAFRAGQEIAWTIEGVRQPANGQVYGDGPQLIEGDTHVTSDYDCFDVHQTYRWAAADIFPVTFESNVLADLGVLAPTVVPGALSQGAKRTARGGAAACRAED